MVSMYRVAGIICLSVLAAFWQGCAKNSKGNGYEGIQFNNVAQFKDKRGQATIKLIVYSGEAEVENIKAYAETLGCGMLYAYFYPTSTPRNEIPIAELETAKSFIDAQDILFKGEGYSKWSYAAQCLGLIPTLTDCQETPGSTNCR